MMEHMIKLDVLIDYIDWDDEVERWALRCEPEDIPAVEVVCGRWELYPSHMHRRCSVCKVEYDKSNFNIRANYCPNCGANMRGGL